MKFEISEAQSFLAEEINKINLEVEPVELYQPIRYILDLGGKRMRPVLTLLGCHLFSNDYSKALYPALAIEVFHNFTLMHDDIMDNAPLRRGNETVHEKWGNNVAILSGDVMLVKAYELLLENDVPHMGKMAKLFNRCACEVCEGQQFDMNFEKIDRISEEDYLNMIRLKTAVLLGLSLQMGAIVGGADDKNADLLREFGVNLGMGFQLKDDLLDVFGDQSKFGKQVGGDIIANKKTFLLIKALEKATGEDAEQLAHWLAAKDFDNEKKVKAVTKIYNNLEIKYTTELKMELYFSKAFQLIEQIDTTEDKRSELIAFVEKIINREK
ncbi:polyprenyl synthetase family protein [Flammeovirgaceae bacterium SG7u.111]|nr:polyprenyl synthetase family protein [Flammeovirgaceae bacterium SG7u.132]WPO34726.1 polyprenyl synthetase family protein [Flammeovirgaceae bacterium SG7u.111]